MKKRNLLVFALLSSILISMMLANSGFTSKSKLPTPEFVPGEVIVGFEDTAIANVKSGLNRLQGQIKRGIKQLNALVVKVKGNEDAFIKAITKIPGVTYAERNGIVHATFTPNDPSYSLQWGLPKIKADEAWDTYRGWNEVTIAIIDTGIDYSHSDLSGRYLAGGYDWVNSDFDPMDDHSHGTHCAGIAAATMNNNIGVAGVAQVKVLAEKVLGSTGSGDWADLASGIIHATDIGVNIISMSLGGYYGSTLVDNACTYSYNKGVLLVAAAGNDNVNIDTYPHYPASYSTVIAVASTTSTDAKSSFSNYGNTVEVSAPGSSIYSTLPGNSYGYKSGTSMACPHVAGFAALIWSYKPQMTRSQVRTAIQNAVDDLGTPGKDIYFGYGRINCRKIIVSPESYSYRFQLSPYSDRVWVNVTPQSGGMLISGKANLTTPHNCYPAPILGWGSGDKFYMTFDWRTTSGCIDLGILIGTISTRTGKLYRTSDGVSWSGPTDVTLVPFATVAEDQPTMAEEIEPTAIQYVEGLNPTQTVAPTYTYSGGLYGIEYTPTVSYPLKKVELMAGGATGSYVVQLRPDNGTGYPSDTVFREVTFTLSNTIGWQGAEFPTSYQVTAGTTYWVVFQPIVGSRASVASSGTMETYTYDNFGTGISWDFRGTQRWMAKFYRQVQPTFPYHFTLSPFSDKVYVDVTSQTGGVLINGIANVTTNNLCYPAPVLGWGVGDTFYMPLDYRTVIGSGCYELGFIVGTISTRTGKLYRTTYGVPWTGPTTINLLWIAEDKTGPTSAE